MTTPKQNETTEEMATKLAIAIANNLGITNNQVRVQLVKLMKDYVTLLKTEFNQYANQPSNTEH